ncbi:MAG: 4Fe-4S binding protein [archaeon]|nr:4Fe-4S binding protein [archaeon]
MATIGCIIKDVGTTTEVKTGGWRSFRPFVTDKCTGCKICESFCPDGCIKVNDKTKKAEIDYDFCKGCLICMNECPFKAIESKRETK